MTEILDIFPIPRVVLQPESNALDSANRRRILTVRFIIPACKKQAQRALRLQS